jgi:putative ABC transport system substrate-binding protein
MVRAKPDVIVVGGTGFAQAAKQATNTIPIVVGGAGDLVGAGLVASLAKPGGNLTGSTEISPDLSGKRLELLKEVIPRGLRVAVLWVNFPGTSDEDEVKQTELTARSLGMKTQSVGVQGPDEFENAYKEMTRQHADALVIIQGSLTNFHRRRLAEHAIKKRLPTMCENSSWAEEGCLISYGPNQPDEWRRAATYVDKILKGAKPADLPVEQPKKFELVINLKTAKQIGSIIPANVLARADRVIR